MSSRVKSTGSASVIGSTITSPAGTRIAHRRDRVWSDRANRPATTRPTGSAIAPTMNDSSARSSGPAATPAPTRSTASGSGPIKSAGGTFNGWRSSEPYAVPAAHASATGGDAASTAFATDATSASAASPTGASSEASALTTTKSGATVRITVNANGLGASTATRPMLHAPHNSTASDDAWRVGPIRDRVGDRRRSRERQRDPGESKKPDRHTRRARSIRLHRRGVRILRTSMTDRPNDTLADPIDEPLVPGLATGIGSLPHTDARAAAEVSLEATPGSLRHPSSRTGTFAS